MVEPGSPWENRYDESFKGKFRDAVLNYEVFYSLARPRIVTERWGRRAKNGFVKGPTRVGQVARNAKAPRPLA
jgi:hypothetical protein